MVHLNGGIMAAIDTETTGLDPQCHEIVELAIIPLDYSLKPHPKIIPFHLKMRPDKPENADYKAMHCNRNELVDLINNGTPQGTAADLLERWFKGLNLGDGRRISPLGFNYSCFDQQMLMQWLGPANYSYIFAHDVRDVMNTALFLNDRTWFVNEKPPFPKYTLSYVASQLNIKNPSPHTALGDAWTTAACYRTMMGKLPITMGEMK